MYMYRSKKLGSSYFSRWRCISCNTTDRKISDALRNLNFFRKINCATLRDELKFILRVQFNNNKQKLPGYYGYISFFRELGNFQNLGHTR
jgi:hypothetical protein